MYVDVCVCVCVCVCRCVGVCRYVGVCRFVFLVITNHERTCDASYLRERTSEALLMTHVRDGESRCC